MPSAVHAAPGGIVTIAGGGSGGLGDDGLATSATLSYPTSVAVDTSGDVYIADYANNRIRKVDHNSGIITTVAGNGTAGYSGDSGPATSASLHSPLGVSVDTAGNIYIADTDNNRIRKVDISGTISTLAGNGTGTYAGDNGPATLASLNSPVGVSVDTSGNIYIADTDSNRIRMVNAFGTITTLAGNGTGTYAGDGGPATSASLYSPTGVSVDASGNIYIADFANNRIREVYSSGTITTVAGNGTVIYSGDGGPATSQGLYAPYGVSVDALGNIFIADTFHSRVLKVDTNGIITTVTGNGTWTYSGDNGAAASATVNRPYGVLVDAAGNINIADTYNHRIRKVLAPAPSINVTDSIAPISDLQMNFGNVTQGMSSSAQTITISNTGSADLTVTSIQISGTDGGQFSLDLSGGTTPCSSLPKTVAAGSNCTVTVTFSPTSVGAKSAALAIASSDLNAATVTVNMSGTGTAIPVPHITVADSVAPNNDLEMPFGNVTEGISSPVQTITISNTGSADLTVASIQISGTDAGQFSLDLSGGTTPCGSLPTTVVAGNNCTVAVTFSPTSTGAKSATLAIASNDSGNSTVNVIVSGTGLSSVTNNPPSAPALVFPADGQIGLGTTVSLRWKKSTDPDGDTVTYHLYTCTDQNFTINCTQYVASSQAHKIYFAGLGMYGGLMMIGIVFAGSRKGRKGLLLLTVIVLLTAGITLASCSGGGGDSTPSPPEISYEVSNLTSGTTYYWKVVADDAKGGTTPSAMWSFSTQ